MNEHTQESCVDEKENLTCTSIMSQYADVSLPLKLKPYAEVGKSVTECCGEPIITLRQCQGTNGSCECEITITQTVCIRVAINYGTDVDVGTSTAICKRPSGNINNGYR